MLFLLKTYGAGEAKKLVYRNFKKKEIEYAHLNKQNKPECKAGFKMCTNTYCVKDYVHCPINSFWLNERKAAKVEENPYVEKFDIGEHEIV
jgi:hypothetical protein